MKNLGIKCVFSAIVVLALSLSAFAQKNIDAEYKTETIYENNQVVYSSKANSWISGTMGEDRIILTKQKSDDAGDYTEFVDEKGETQIAFGTGFEFMYNDKLIAQDVYGLKFFSIYYDKEKQAFDRKNVVINSLNNVFPDVKIIKISEFKDNVLKVKKAPFKKMKLLLVNDTSEYFLNYHFEGENFEHYNMAGMLEVHKMGKIKFAYPNDDFRALTIKVRPF